MTRREMAYLTDEQHRHGGWIGSIKCEVIFERALSRSNSEDLHQTDKWFHCRCRAV